MSDRAVAADIDLTYGVPRCSPLLHANAIVFAEDVRVKLVTQSRGAQQGGGAYGPQKPLP